MDEMFADLLAPSQLELLQVKLKVDEELPIAVAALLAYDAQKRVCAPVEMAVNLWQDDMLPETFTLADKSLADLLPENDGSALLALLALNNLSEQPAAALEVEAVCEKLLAENEGMNPAAARLLAIDAACRMADEMKPAVQQWLDGTLDEDFEAGGMSVGLVKELMGVTTPIALLMQNLMVTDEEAYNELRWIEEVDFCEFE